MKIAIGSDHGGINLKPALIDHLKKNGFDYVDFGCYDDRSVDYPDFALEVAEAVASKKCDLGILICGTGIGMSMAANKHKSIRAAVCTDLKSAEFTRLHNDANVLCMGERIIPYELAQEITEKYLTTEILGGKHKTRIDMFSK